MVGRILFLSLLAAALGGITPTNKPFNPEYRSQNEDNTPYLYSTITENPELKNNEELKPNREEVDLNKKPDQNSMELKTNDIELESNGKESELNNKTPKRNSNESVSPKNKELEPNSKKPFRRSGLEFGTQKSNEILISSKENDTLVSRNNQNAVSQESEEILLEEKPISKRNKQSEETHFSNKKSESPKKGLNITSNLKPNLGKELEKPTFSGAQPVSRGDDGYNKIPKDFFVKWIQPNIVKNRMNARKKPLHHKYAFSPDYRDNNIPHYDSIESQSTNYDEDDNEIVEKKIPSLHYLQKHQDLDALSHDNHKIQVYKELLGKIFELLQYLIIEKSHNAYYLNDYKAKINKETLTQIYDLLYQLLEEQDQNQPVSQSEKTKINDNLLADISGLLNVLTEKQSKNLRQLESKNINKKLLADIFAFLQNLPEEDNDSLREGQNPKVNRGQRFTLIKNVSDDQDEKVPPIEGKKSKSNKELLTQIFATLNIPKERDQNESGKIKDRKELLTNLFAMYNTQNEQNQNEPLGGEISKDNKGLMTQQLFIIDAQNEQAEKAPSLDRVISNEYNGLISHLLAIINAQNVQDEKATSLDKKISKDNIRLMTQLLAIMNAQNFQDEKVTPLGRAILNKNSGLITKPNTIINAKNKQDQNTSPVLRDNTKINNANLTKLFAIFNTQNDQGKEASPIARDSTKDNEELLTQNEQSQNNTLPVDEKTTNNELLNEVSATLNAQIDKSQTTPPLEQKQDGNNEKLTQIIAMLQNVTKEIGQKPTPPEGQKTINVDYELLGKLLGMLLNIPQGQAQAPPQTPGYIVPTNSEYLSLKQLDYLRYLLDQQNRNTPQAQISYGDKEIQMKLMQLIKDTKEAIDLKVRPVQMVHEAYKTHRLYKTGYLISSINRTYESVIEFYKYIQQNINAWNILKVLQAYEQVKAADQFLTKSLHILSILSGDVRIAQPSQRTLQRSHQRALEHTRKLAREGNHTRDLEDTHQVAQDHNIVYEDIHESIYETGSQRANQNGLLDRTWNNNQKRIQNRIFKHKYERLLRSNMMALKDITRSLLNQEIDLEGNSGPLQHNQKRTASNNERDASERAFANQNRFDKLLQHCRKRTLERSKAPESHHNLKRTLLRDYKRILKRNKNALKDAYELTNQKGELERNSKPEPQNHLKTALLREFERLLQRNQKWALEDFERASGNQKRPFGSENRLGLQRHQKRALTDAYNLALSKEKRPLEIQRNQRILRDANKPISDNRKRQTSEDNSELGSRSQKAAERTFGSGFQHVPLEFQPDQKMGHYNHGNRGKYKPMTNPHYPVYPQNVDYNQKKMFRQPLCDIDDSLAPCNTDNDKLKWDPLQHQQSVSWSYYDYYY